MIAIVTCGCSEAHNERDREQKNLCWMAGRSISEGEAKKKEKHHKQTFSRSYSVMCGCSEMHDKRDREQKSLIK